MKNNILGAVVYLSTAIVFGGSTALLMLFMCGAVAICAGMVVNHYLLRL